MRRIRNSYLYIIILVLSQSLNGQVKDFRTWYSLGVEGELFNLVDFDVTPEVRFWDNSSRLGSFLTEADASVPVFGFLRFGLNYRYQAVFDRKKLVSELNRYGIYAELTQKVERFRFTYRALYHQEYQDFNTSELGKIPVVQHRHKFSVRYRNKDWKISPAVSGEWFFTLSPDWEASQEKLRLSAGIDYELTKMIELGISYKYQQEFYENNPITSHIGNFELVIKL
jgi:hypothetical protein